VLFKVLSSLISIHLLATKIRYHLSWASQLTASSRHQQFRTIIIHHIRDRWTTEVIRYWNFFNNINLSWIL